MAKITDKIGRVALVAGIATAALLGCPLYEDSCDSRSDCASGYVCDLFSQRCEPVIEAIGCRRPEECYAGETCTPNFVCRPGSCEFHGCVSGYRCGVVESAHACVFGADAGNGDASVAPADAGGREDAGAALDAGLPDASLLDAAADAATDAAL